MPNADGPSALSVPVSQQRDHILGALSAPAVLVEYGDYECPYCGRAQETIKYLRGHMADTLCIVFRHFPLTQIHPRAERAAEAAEAAAAQGRFWEMHTTLYDNQDALEDADLAKYAGKIGLDVKRFAADLTQGVYAPRV